MTAIVRVSRIGRRRTLIPQSLAAGRTLGTIRWKVGSGAEIHPPENAVQTWSEFSAGEWDGDTLAVTTWTTDKFVETAYQSLHQAGKQQVSEN
jgi:hypothetical protein